MGIAIKTCIAIYCNTDGHIMILIPIYWDRILAVCDITGTSVYCDVVKKTIRTTIRFVTIVYRQFPESIVYFH